MKLNLQFFGDTGKSGSGGAAMPTAEKTNRYTAAYNFWKKEANAGVRQLFQELEAEAGGKLGDKIVSVPYKWNSPIGKVLSERQRSGGTENLFFGRNKEGFATINANRTGMIELSEWLKDRLKAGKRWY